MPNNNLEIEAKFFVSDLAPLREHLLKQGATVTKPRIFERNIRYDNAWDGLRQRGAILRLRQDAQATITYKGIPPNHTGQESEIRVREEIEITVSDFDTAHLLLQRIGFEQRQRYDKYRETFRLNGLEVVLDELPYGDFIEIEGDEAAIRDTANQLGLDWNKQTPMSYLALLANLNDLSGLAIPDLTFEQFADLDVTVAPLFS